MCAHTVIGMSVMVLTCSAMVASTLGRTGPETKIISAVYGDASASDNAPCVVHNDLAGTSAEEKRHHWLVAGNSGISGPIYFTTVTEVAAGHSEKLADLGPPVDTEPDE